MRRIAPVFLMLALQGCFGGSTPEPDPNAIGLGAEGDYEVCSYTSGLESDSYRSARMSYPCDLTDGPYPATTLTGGFTNTKEQMYWLADHLSSHGYVVIAITPTNNYSSPPTWKTAHLGGFQKLEDENLRLQSPVMLNVALDRRAIMGFSMGGGGTLLAAGELGGQYKTAVALAPYLGVSVPNYDNIQSPIAILGSENDTLAPVTSITRYYQKLPATLTRNFSVFTNTQHSDWFLSGNETEQTKFKTLITAWLNLYLKEDQSARSYFDGADHDQQAADGWFSAFDYQP